MTMTFFSRKFNLDNLNLSHGGSSNQAQFFYAKKYSKL
jgi:hypothetical protein